MSELTPEEKVIQTIEGTLKKAVASGTVDTFEIYIGFKRCRWSLLWSRFGMTKNGKPRKIPVKNEASG